ncbi:MAG: hypothetical protein ACI843_000728, partial [Psychrobacter glaciei]
HQKIIESLPSIVFANFFENDAALRIFSHIKLIVKKKRFDASV